MPNVSHCIQENEVHYNPYVDPYNGHDYVEIAGIKWATMNVGASGVTDYGLYFQWGDTSGYTADEVGSGDGKKYFGWEDYKYGNGTSSPGTTGISKYNSIDGKTVLESEDDAVHAAWGGNWRMPTQEEFNKLKDNSEKRWVTKDGVSGYEFAVSGDTEFTGATLFFPAAGGCNDGNVRNVGSGGGCWSSSLRSDGVSRAWDLDFYYGGIGVSYDYRYSGYPVRGVVGQ